MTVYWKKTKGHSKVEGFEKLGNDQADELANTGAYIGEALDLDHLLNIQQVDVVTRQQTKRDEERSVQWSRDIPDPDLITAQKQDPIVGTFYKYIEDPENNPIPEEVLKELEELRIMMKYKSSYKILDGLLVRQSKDGPLQWVVPMSFRGIMLDHSHNEISSGHRGVKNTLEILQQVAYWPHMKQDVDTYNKGCLICAQFQPNAPKLSHRAPLMKRGVVFPWSDIQIDFIGPVVRSARGNKYMLTVVCQFTKWVECIPAPNCRADTTALLLINHIFCRMGLPQRISSDRGSSFTADIMTRMWEILGVKRKLHIAYHPASSGTVERYNQTIVSILKKFVNETGSDWDLKLPLVLMAIRATPSASTGYSPFELLTGRRMVVPAHLLYKTNEQTLISVSSVHDYVADLHRHLQFAFAHAQQNLEKAAEYSKTHYDLRTSKFEYQIGDRIYLYNFLKDKVKESKFLPSWKGPFEIIDKMSPVAYKVRIVKGKKIDERWVHLNQIKVAHPQSRLEEIEGTAIQVEPE